MNSWRIGRKCLGLKERPDYYLNTDIHQPSELSEFKRVQESLRVSVSSSYAQDRIQVMLFCLNIHYQI